MVESIAILIVAMPALWLRRWQLVGTTLRSMWWWQVIGVTTMISADCYLATQSDVNQTTTDAFRFAAASFTFCPMMSVLGAKQPQDKAWNFIVLTLWGIVALPALEAITIHANQPMELSAARSWFVFVLIVVSAANMIGTRSTKSALLTATSQCLLFAPHLPLGIDRIGGSYRIGMLLFIVAIGLDVVVTHFKRPAKIDCDRLWLDFRDLFGTLWSLRVAERVNAASEMYDWGIRLRWSGFRDRETGAKLKQLDPATRKALRTTIVNLLRRFVSDGWIETRFPKKNDDT